MAVVEFKLLKASKILKSAVFHDFLLRTMGNVKFLPSIFYCVQNLRRNKLHNNLIMIKRFVKENWGAPFIVGFMFLLIDTGFLVSLGSDLADTSALLAFFALVAGVVLQLVSFLKYPHIDDSEVL